MSIDIRSNWTREEARNLFALPFADLLFQAQTMHRKYFDPNKVQLSTLMSIKTGACPEDCGYCSQSARYSTGLKIEKLLPTEKIIETAKQAKANGASRFCMGAGWRNLPPKAVEQIKTVIREVNALGMETCMTLGMLTEVQANELAEAGLNYYNHNLDTSPEYYPKVTTTRTYQDRLDTLEHVRNAGMHTCSGGIIGMGESAEDRVGLLVTLANLPQQPESVPINMLVPIEGTPLGDSAPLDPFDFVRTIAVARIMMPRAYVRLSAGRRSLADEAQALCFQAGANSIFYGDKLLTTGNPDVENDRKLFNRLGITSLGYEETYSADSALCKTETVSNNSKSTGCHSTLT